MTTNSNTIPKLIQVISYAINRYSTIPLISRMQLYDSLQHYIFSQENKITILENKILQLQKKIEIFENNNNRHILK